MFIIKRVDVVDIHCILTHLIYIRLSIYSNRIENQISMPWYTYLSKILKWIITVFHFIKIHLKLYNNHAKDETLSIIPSHF